MGKTGKLIIVAVVIVAVAGGAVLLTAQKTKDTTSKPPSQSAPAPDMSSTPNSSAATNPPAGGPAATITYTGSGFEPASSMVKAGDTVKVVNASQGPLQFDSDPHPVHTNEPELNVGEIAAGESQTFTVTKKGTWGFHNHLNSSQRGTLTVQ